MASIEFKFKIDIKTVRKCFALLEQDIPSDEELISQFSSITVDLSPYGNDKEVNEAQMGITIMAVAIFLEQKGIIPKEQ